MTNERERLRERLEQIAAQPKQFDGSHFELDGYEPEDAKRGGYHDGQVDLAKELLALLTASPVDSAPEPIKCRGKIFEPGEPYTRTDSEEEEERWLTALAVAVTLGGLSTSQESEVLAHVNGYVEQDHSRAILDESLYATIRKQIEAHYTEQLTQSQDEPLYPCDHPGCEVMRTKAEGGTTFSLCEEHLQEHYRGSAPEEEREPMTREEARGWWEIVNRRTFKEEPKP